MAQLLTVPSELQSIANSLVFFFVMFIKGTTTLENLGINFL